jgi:hypothetical protein
MRSGREPDGERNGREKEKQTEEEKTPAWKAASGH